MFDTLSIGSATLDIFLRADSFQASRRGGTEYLLIEEGSKHDVGDFSMQSGGGATNTAVGWSRLGLRAGVIAEMGKDMAAEAVRRELENEKVDLSFIVQEKTEQTAVSVLLISADGGRTAITARGAANMLTVGDIDWARVQANWLHISSVGNLPVIKRAAKHCRDQRIRFSWNPGGKELASIEKGDLHVTEVRPTLFCVNEEEAQRVEKAGYKLEQCGEIVIVTNGRHGGRWYEHGRWYEYGSETTKVVQETGAGDAFLTGVIAGYLHDRRTIEAVEWGKREAMSVVQHMGAKTGLLRSLK